MLGLGLVTGGDLDDATIDGIWALSSPEVFAKLVLDRGWSPDAYRAWLTETAAHVLSARPNAELEET